MAVGDAEESVAGMLRTTGTPAPAAAIPKNFLLRILFDIVIISSWRILPKPSINQNGRNAQEGERKSPRRISPASTREERAGRVVIAHLEKLGNGKHLVANVLGIEDRHGDGQANRGCPFCGPRTEAL